MTFFFRVRAIDSNVVALIFIAKTILFDTLGVEKLHFLLCIHVSPET